MAEATHWAYAGEAGPAAWASRDQAGAACATGAAQSPVDLAAAAKFNSFFAPLALEVADNAAAPHYLPSSFFSRFEKRP